VQLIKKVSYNETSQKFHDKWPQSTPKTPQYQNNIKTISKQYQNNIKTISNPTSVKIPCTYTP